MQGFAMLRVPISEKFIEGNVWKVKAKQGTYNVGDNGCVVRYVKSPLKGARLCCYQREFRLEGVVG